MDLLKLIVSARTCRRFRNDAPLGPDDLRWLAECARLVPCGRNAQELRLALISAPDKCEEMTRQCTWAAALKDWDGPSHSELPSGYIVILAPEKASVTQGMDIGIVAQTINLAAASRSWGTCCIYAFNRPQVSQLIGMPEGMIPALVIAVGPAGEERRIADAIPGAPLSYWRDADSVHHVPKIPLRELITKEL